LSSTIFIADDHALTIDGTIAAISVLDAFEVIGRASNGIEAISSIKQTKPDCAILDLVMPGASGLEVMIEARRWSPATKFAIVTGSPSSTNLSQLVNAGANGVFLKTGSVDELLRGLQDIVSGKSVISEAAEGMLQAGQQFEQLSKREIEILNCISRGFANNRTAEHLGISPKTVDNHRTNLMRKLGVHSTATLLVRAMRDGLIDV
jgi:DNA-binding NarL/FixJ family response regulator